MKPMKPIFLTLVVALALSGTVFALEDSQQNRAIQAGRYIQAVSLSDLFKDMAEQALTGLPPDQRLEAMEMVTTHLDLDALTQSVSEIMIKHFTADELKALADFYGSPLGKSAMKKFGAYMADVMPILEAEMSKAKAKATRELDDQSK